MVNSMNEDFVCANVKSRCGYRDEAGAFPQVTPFPDCVQSELDTSREALN